MKSGESIGQYNIESVLGRGGMGTVYAVKHRVLGVRHALKVLHPEVADSSEGRERFRREARVMHDLGKAHPNILEVDDYGEEPGGTLWLRMPLMKGMPGLNGERWVTLEDRMEAEGRLPESAVRNLLEQILDGLGFAHEQGALHRDLKPANILLAEDGSVRIADFGLVKVVDGAWLHSQFEKSIAKTAGFGKTIHEGDICSPANALLGTWAYLAPEVKKRAEAIAQSDLWSIGLIAFQMITDEDSPGFKLPSRMVEGLNPDWDRWIELAEAKNPGERFAAAEEMRACLPFARSKVNPRTAETLQSQNPVTESNELENLQMFPPLFSPTVNEELLNALKRRKKFTIRQIVKRFTGFMIIASAIWISFKYPEFKGKLLTNDHIKQTSSVEIVSAPPGAEVTDFESSALGATPIHSREADVIPESATNSNPFVNSLGMKFVPVPIDFRHGDETKVIFSIWETRVKDYAAFLTDSRILKKDRNSGKVTGKNQELDHPVVNVSMNDARAYCEWLTLKERQTGRISGGLSYRLPFDFEWSFAVDIGNREKNDDSPEEKSAWDGNHDYYPWGIDWPPPSRAGNYLIKESNQIGFDKSDDKDSSTSSVGFFPSNLFGIYDLGGNVWEWCEVEEAESRTFGILRGGSWKEKGQSRLRSSYRDLRPIDFCSEDTGFRCVLEIKKTD